MTIQPAVALKNILTLYVRQYADYLMPVARAKYPHFSTDEAIQRVNSFLAKEFQAKQANADPTKYAAITDALNDVSSHYQQQTWSALFKQFVDEVAEQDANNLAEILELVSKTVGGFKISTAMLKQGVFPYLCQKMVEQQVLESSLLGEHKEAIVKNALEHYRFHDQHFCINALTDGQQQALANAMNPHTKDPIWQSSKMQLQGVHPERVAAVTNDLPWPQAKIIDDQYQIEYTAQYVKFIHPAATAEALVLNAHDHNGALNDAFKPFIFQNHYNVTVFNHEYYAWDMGDIERYLGTLEHPENLRYVAVNAHGESDAEGQHIISISPQEKVQAVEFLTLFTNPKFFCNF